MWDAAYLDGFTVEVKLADHLCVQMSLRMGINNKQQQDCRSVNPPHAICRRGKWPMEHTDRHCTLRRLRIDSPSHRHVHIAT